MPSRKLIPTPKRPIAMIKTVEKTIIEQDMLKRGEHLLVALSGGPDSTALLHAMTHLAPRYDLRLTAAHLNHGTRAAESERDEAFVRELCLTMGVRCICRKIEAGALAGIRGHSLEEAAREARYRFLVEAAQACGADKIATGHHRDDQAETLLINLLRGSGPDGLKGILPVRDGWIIRPLIQVDRARITAYLERNNVPSVQDSSNSENHFLRNRIRNELIPLLTERYNPQLSQILYQTSEIMRRESDCLQRLVLENLAAWGIHAEDGRIELPLKAFGELHEALQGRIIKKLAEGGGPRRRGIAYRHVQSVLQLIKKPRSVSCLHLPDNLKVEKAGDFLTITRDVGSRCRKRGLDGRMSQALDIRTETPGALSLQGSGRVLHWWFIEKPALSVMKASPQTAFMDFDRIRLPVVIRHWLPGDSMVLLGMEGTKKLTDYFVDRKIPLSARGKIPLLVDAGSVIWIAGERISERVKLTEGTKKVLKVEMI